MNRPPPAIEIAGFIAEISMKRLAALVLALTIFAAAPAPAQIFRGPNSAKQAQKAARRSNKQAEKRQRRAAKAAKKTLKAQRKAAKRASRGR